MIDNTIKVIRNGIRESGAGLGCAAGVVGQDKAAWEMKQKLLIFRYSSIKYFSSISSCLLSADSCPRFIFSPRSIFFLTSSTSSTISSKNLAFLVLFKSLNSSGTTFL